MNLPMSTNHLPNTDNTLRATGVVLGLLSQLAGLIVGFTALAYIIGWKEASAYYSELGAPWVTSLLTPTQVMQTSIPLISTIAVVTLISVAELASQNIGVRWLRRWAIIFIILATITYLLSLAIDNRSGVTALIFLSSMLWAFSTGATIGELIGCLALKEIKWGGYEVYLLYFVLFFCFSQAPDLMGKSRASLIERADSTSLPKVNLAGTTDAWGLIGPCGDKLLLISLGQDRHDRLFKLVASENIVGIRTTKTDKK